MTTTDRVPNHHAHHGGFAGPLGLIAALSMLHKRDGDARVAFRLTDLEPGDRGLDIGCGPGVAARNAAKLGATVVGVDPAPVMLRVARALTHGASVEFRQGTAESLPVEDASIDAAWSIACAHHWHDVDAGLREVLRVLRPNARFVAIERRTEPGARGHASHGWTTEQAEVFADRCRACGFTDVRVEHGTGQRGPLLAVVASKG